MLFCNAKNRTMKTCLLFRMTIDYCVSVKNQEKQVEFWPVFALINGRQIYFSIIPETSWLY